MIKTKHAVLALGISLGAVAAFSYLTPGPGLPGPGTADSAVPAVAAPAVRTPPLDAPALVVPDGAAPSAADAERVPDWWPGPPPSGYRAGCQTEWVPQYDSRGREVGKTCRPSEYWEYSNETLETLVYADAEAARVLANRLRHTDLPRAIQLAIRSTALSHGNTSPLRQASIWGNQADANGELTLEGIGHAYVFEALASKIGSFEYRPPLHRVRQIEARSDDARRIIGELDVLVEQIYKDIRRIELEVTGKQTIGRDDHV